MTPSSAEKSIKQMALFRKNMGMDLPEYKIRQFWGEDFVKIGTKTKDSVKKIVSRKIKILEKHLDKFLISDWVKFIGITGSVASGKVMEDDDIDVLIVVKNDRMWLYRGLLVLRLGSGIRRVWGKSSVDKIDTNFICEEKGVCFHDRNIFVLHELLFMIPVYNQDYYQKILGVNSDLLESFAITSVKKEYVNSRRNYFYAVLDFFAFFIQYIYMLLKRHHPDLDRLKKNNKRRRIEFFPKDFSPRKIEEYRGLAEKED